MKTAHTFPHVDSHTKKGQAQIQHAFFLCPFWCHAYIIDIKMAFEACSVLSTGKIDGPYF